MALSKELEIVCGWCYSKSKLSEWDNKTFEQCTNREMKRAYVSLTNEKVFKKGSEKYYICPKCGKWLLGENLTIADSKEHEDLGGELVVKV